jgi:adenylate/nucleoside-diphosphate kinase
LIAENIKLQNELGKKAQEILLKGGAIPEDMVAKMIDEKIKSPEVAHHGEKIISNLLVIKSYYYFSSN